MSEDVITVAHRHGNELRRVPEAEVAGVDMIEADVWLFRGRLEVRHSKTLGPIPLLWDRWKIERPWRHRLRFEDLAAAVHRNTELMVDIKSADRRLPAALIEEARRLLPGRTYTVATQQWHQLEAFEDVPEARIVYSVGSEEMLSALPSALEGRRVDGIGVHYPLLDAERAARLRERAPRLFSWTLNDAELAERLVRLGANGVISDDLAVLRHVTELGASERAREV